MLCFLSDLTCCVNFIVFPVFQSASRVFVTPGGTEHAIVLNPFEKNFSDRLHGNSPMFSPNMFKVCEPGSAEKVNTDFTMSKPRVNLVHFRNKITFNVLFFFSRRVISVGPSTSSPFLNRPTWKSGHCRQDTLNIM